MWFDKSLCQTAPLNPMSRFNHRRHKNFIYNTIYDNTKRPKERNTPYPEKLKFRDTINIPLTVKEDFFEYYIVAV